MFAASCTHASHVLKSGNAPLACAQLYEASGSCMLLLYVVRMLQDDVVVSFVVTAALICSKGFGSVILYLGPLILYSPKLCLRACSIPAGL